MDHRKFFKISFRGGRISLVIVIKIAIMATDWNLITKYVQGKTSPEEQQQLQDWLDEDVAHREILEKTQRAWEASGDVYQAYTPDTQQAWQAIDQRLDDTPVVEFTARTERKTWWLRAAAIAGVVVGLVYLGQWLSVLGRWGLAEMSTAERERAQLTLADGTQVWLNKNTRLRYPKKFTDSSRTVYLEGEAFFDVTRNENQPFQIISGEAVTRVLGTSFEVSARPQDTVVIVTVASGVVALAEFSVKNQELVLRKGDQGWLSTASGKVSRANTVNQNTLAWYTRQIVFENRPLTKVGLLLEDVYQRKVEIDPAIQDLKLTAEFDDQSLEEVLEVIALTLDVQYELADEVVYLKKIEK